MSGHWIEINSQMKSIVSTAIKERIQASLAMMPPTRANGTPRVVVLSYHSVSQSSGAGATSTDALESHMRWLRQTCEVVPLNEIPDRARRRQGHRPTVSVTFDDGFADNYTNAMPILLRYEIPATFFVPTGLIDRDPSVLELASKWGGWPEDGATLTWEQIREMRRAGMVFGAHGHRHIPLGPLNAKDAHADLSTSKRILEDRLEEPIPYVAFPYGRPRRHVTLETLVLAEELGFQFGAMVLHRGVRGDDSPLGIPRFVIGGDSTQMLRAKVVGSFDLMGLYQERAPLWVVRIVAGRHFLA
jgi:peptidoglycan/xylan/chitin deacetylase (PgdA/CDA1 family)